MTTLKDALVRTATAKKGPPCTMGAWLQGLSDKERAEAKELLADPSWRHRQISDALKSLGVHVAPATVSRHRRGECRNCE